MEPAWGRQGPECATGSRHESAAPADAARARLAPTAGDRLSPERIGRRACSRPSPPLLEVHEEYLEAAPAAGKTILGDFEVSLLVAAVSSPVVG